MNDPLAAADHVVPENPSPSTNAASPESLVRTLPYLPEEFQAVTNLGLMGRYRLLLTVGSGAFGVVYKAHDDELKRDVAIKLLKHTGGKQAELLLAEARTLAQLDHPAIVPVYDMGRATDGAVFVVSKFFEGSTLAIWLQTRRPAVREAVRWTTIVAEALDYAHRQGLIHRDVKPANILLTSNGDPVLADFGLAMHESAFGSGARFVGTPSYMSPEQARHEGHRVDGRTDIYSLGTVLYEMLTGTRPFHAENRDELLDLIRNVEARPPRQLDRNVPRELERICLKALSKRAADRYSTAQDFATDLQLWLDGNRDFVREASAAATPESHVESGSSHNLSQKPVVVPRGLRAFDEADADFFLSLLPGARDRDGLPESVRFWKSHVEATDDSRSFRVGVLLGPSGSGKSSLVRAGLTPTLADDIQVLTIEATAIGFEEQLLKRLRRDVDGLPGVGSLRDATTLIRQQTAKLRGRKLLLVIDQFEQWLNAHAGQERTELVEALRQCDGTTLQAMLLVRDDFTLAISRFMDELEEPLQQNRNFAAVDLFSPDHAARVLEAFGRAYRVWEQEPSRDQQRFMEQAIQQLAANGRLVPVQLAVFADMVKDRPWSVATLQQLGGMEGIGVAFLDERLAGPKSHPEVQAHLPAIRQLLRLLLPSDAENIKGRGRTRGELAADLAGLLTPEQLDRLLVLLDVEVRLITPAGGAVSESSDSSSASREPTYQLAHDYLVPSLRAWLSANERATRAGRARLRLRELAEGWRRQPTVRRLPTWFEWTLIRLLTRRAEWSDSERAMMTTATRRIGTTAAIGLVLALAIGLVGREVMGRWQAKMLVERLLNADTTDVSEILPQLRQTVRWSRPALLQLANSPEMSGDHSTLDDRDRRRKLHVSLALAAGDKQQLGSLLDQLPSIPVEHLATVRKELMPYASQVTSQLQSRFATSLQDKGREALPIGAVLAGLTEANTDWTRHGDALAKRLISTRSTQIRLWGELYRPIASQLMPKLLHHFRAVPLTDIQTRGNLIELITQYAGRDAAQIVTAMEYAQPKELPELVELTLQDSRATRTELRKRLNQLDPGRKLPTAIPPSTLPADIARVFQNTDGAIDGEIAWSPKLREDTFAALAKRMQEHGFSIDCLRSFTDQGTRLVAAVFRQDPRPSEFRWRLPLPEAEAAIDQMKNEGWDMVDFCATTESDGAEPLWSLLWKKRAADAPETRAYLNATYAEHRKGEQELPEQGFVAMRFASQINSEGELRTAAIWQKRSTKDTQSSTSWRYAAFAANRNPNAIQEDVRGYLVSLTAGDRLPLIESAQSNETQGREKRVVTTEKQLTANLQADGALMDAVDMWSSAGAFDVALKIIDELAIRRRSSMRFRDHRATAFARMGGLEKLKADLNEIPALVEKAKTGDGEKLKPGVIPLLKLRVAVLEHDVAAANAALAELRAGAEASNDQLERFVCGLGIVASLPQAQEAVVKEFATVFVRPAWQIAFDQPEKLIWGIDCAGARQLPTIQSVITKFEFDRRYHATFHTSDPIESRQLLALSSSEHISASRLLRSAGFQPVVIDVLPGVSGREVTCSSVWHRAVMPPNVRLSQVRRSANLVLALAAVNDWDVPLSALRGELSRDVRSAVQIHLAKVVDGKTLLKRLLDDGSLSTELQASILLTLGGYRREDIPTDLAENLRLRVVAWAQTADDPGLRSAAEWCARQWQIPWDVPTTLAATGSQTGKRWERNAIGQVMVVMKPTKQFKSGSPRWEEGHEAVEAVAWSKINRSFAISATEVTNAEYREFEKSKDNVEAPRAPRQKVEVLDAHRFCNWLSKRDQIAESEWCYVDVDKVGAANAPFPKNQLERSGYRLPTELEWEYAARAGAEEAFYFGDDASFIEGFAWMSRNSGGTAHDVATVRPNDFGLFDMIGNVMEWATPSRRFPLTSNLRTDSLSEELWNEAMAGKTKPKSIRGGAFSNASVNSRMAKRSAPSQVTTSMGFRVARTLRDDSSQ